MAEVTIGHHPELAVENAISIFEKHFAGKYEVLPAPRAPFWDFVIKRNAWQGVRVRLHQKPNNTSFVLRGSATALWAILLTSLTLGLLSLSIHKEITHEVRSFIETAQEFK